MQCSIHVDVHTLFIPQFTRVLLRWHAWTYEGLRFQEKHVIIIRMSQMKITVVAQVDAGLWQL